MFLFALPHADEAGSSILDTFCDYCTNKCTSEVTSYSTPLEVGAFKNMGSVQWLHSTFGLCLEDKLAAAGSMDWHGDGQASKARRELLISDFISDQAAVCSVPELIHFIYKLWYFQRTISA